MSADVSRPVSFLAGSPSQEFQSVVHQQVKALLDFELNEAQEILRARMDRLVGTLGESGNLFGGSGWVTPSGAARSIVVAGGLSTQNGNIVRIPVVAALQVFNSGTSTGTVTSCVYVEWWDSEVTGGMDANIQDNTYGETARRTLRNVQVNVNIGASTIPSLTGGHTAFILCLVTHNFDVNGTTVIQSDIAMSPVGVTPGELAGTGPVRPLLMKSRVANSATAVAWILDTITNLTTAGAKLYSWRNAGVEKAWVDKDGNFSGTGVYNGIDITALGAGGSLINHSVLQGLTTGDPHTQYVSVATARTITGVHTFNPAAPGAAFILGANSTGQLIAGLNAALLNGQAGSFYTNASNITAGTLAAAQLPATAMRTDVVQTVTTRKLFQATAATLLLAMQATGDTVDRWNIDTAGKQQWGTGGGAVDTALYRNGAAVLKTDGTLQANVLESVVATGTAPLTIASTTLVANLNVGLLNGQVPSFYTNASNLAAGTVSDARLSTNVDLLNAVQIISAKKTFQAASGGSVVAAAQVLADAQPRWALTSDGIQQFSTGAAAADAVFYRSGVGILKTDTALNVGTTLTVGTGLTVSAGGASITGNQTVIGQSVSPLFDNANSGTFNMNNGNGQTLTLNGNKTLVFNNGQAGAVYVFRLKQDGTGNRTVTWPSGMWPVSGTPTLSTGANLVDLFTAFCVSPGVFEGVTSGIGYTQ